MTSPGITSTEEPSRHSHLVPGVLAAGLIVLFGAVYVYGSAARVASERAETALVEQENQTFCAGLGLSEKSEQYTRCMSGLTTIRQRQRERFDADAAGIL